MDYKKIVILVVCLLIPFVQGVEIGVVVDFPDGQTHGECIKTNTGTNGYEVLKKLSLTTLWSDPASFGHQLCKVKGIGDDVSGSTCEYVGNYWRFFIQKNNKWEYMPIGFDAGNSCWNQDLNSFNGHYCAKEGEVIGLSYGAFDAPLPQIKSFDDICNTLAISDVKVYVDGKKESDADESGGDIQARPSSKIEIEVEIENLGQTQVEDVKGEIIIKDIQKGISHKKPEVLVDRKEAIARALAKASLGDTIIITGKGAEPWMMTKDGQKIPWDDRAVVREALAEREGVV